MSGAVFISDDLVFFLIIIHCSITLQSDCWHSCSDQRSQNKLKWFNERGWHPQKTVVYWLEEIPKILISYFWKFLQWDNSHQKYHFALFSTRSYTIVIFCSITLPNWLLVFSCFYRTRVRSLSCLVSNSLTNWLLPFSKLDWCDPGVWRCQLKTCWGCFCCWCWWWGSCWQQFVSDLGAEVWS